MFQSKTLAGDSSVMFSPPSIVKHSLLEESTSLHSLISTENTPEPLKYESTYENLDIESIITEKTKVQHRSNPLPNLYQDYNVFKDITNLNNLNTASFSRVKEQDLFSRVKDQDTFSRLNAERLRTITTSNDLACENLIAPKEVLANALADHIYKVTNQKPSTSKIDEILTNKMKGSDLKENHWWTDKDTGQDLYNGDYYVFSDNNMQ